jgi:hypothetical protein
MATETIRTSDVSGRPIKDDEAVWIRIEFRDGKRPSMRLDAADEEVKELLEHARPMKGRKRFKDDEGDFVGEDEA